MAEEPQPALPSQRPPPESEPEPESKGSDGRGEPPQAVSVFPPAWKLAFALFAAGFLLLVVAAKLELRPAFDWLLKGLGVIACLAGLFAARRAQRKPLK